jgi:hypothetical protein
MDSSDANNVDTAIDGDNEITIKDETKKRYLPEFQKCTTTNIKDLLCNPNLSLWELDKNL